MHIFIVRVPRQIGVFKVIKGGWHHTIVPFVRVEFGPNDPVAAYVE